MDEKTKQTLRQIARHLGDLAMKYRTYRTSEQLGSGAEYAHQWQRLDLVNSQQGDWKKGVQFALKRSWNDMYDIFEKAGCDQDVIEEVQANHRWFEASLYHQKSKRPEVTIENWCEGASDGFDTICRMVRWVEDYYDFWRSQDRILLRNWLLDFSHTGIRRVKSSITGITYECDIEGKGDIFNIRLYRLKRGFLKTERILIGRYQLEKGFLVGDPSLYASV